MDLITIEYVLKCVENLDDAQHIKNELKSIKEQILLELEEEP